MKKNYLGLGGSLLLGCTLGLEFSAYHKRDDALEERVAVTLESPAITEVREEPKMSFYQRVQCIDNVIGEYISKF